MMATKEEDLVIALKQLVDAIINSDKIDSFKFNAMNEFHETPTKFGSEKEPTGWVNIDLNIRFHLKDRLQRPTRPFLDSFVNDGCENVYCNLARQMEEDKCNSKP